MFPRCADNRFKLCAAAPGDRRRAPRFHLRRQISALRPAYMRGRLRNAGICDVGEAAPGPAEVQHLLPCAFPPVPLFCVSLAPPGIPPPRTWHQHAPPGAEEGRWDGDANWPTAITQSANHVCPSSVNRRLPLPFLSFGSRCCLVQCSGGDEGRLKNDR